ncbi:hypothetical protein VNI00_015551 [Paramarasmius palmivorus]|uniref:Uncharacterized protein n=1 Tax=Paramarasmius palmivorus TaxID=297713 RepID=A0AAW0AN24_9AGAR
MDYIIAAALLSHPGWGVLLAILLVYDIACQWFKNLKSRALNWPLGLKLPPSAKILPAIGKLHLPGHKEKDYEQFNLNLIPGAAQVDGESWAREDYLEGHFSSWNEEKYTGMGGSLWRSYRDAVKDRNLQADAHRGLTENLPTKLVEEWESLCRLWENAEYPKRGVVNPYVIPEANISVREALKELEQKEELRLKSGRPSYHQITASAFITLALEIQDAQSSKAGSNGKSDAKVWLPSLIQKSERDAVCLPGVWEVEAKLQEARCYDSLNAIRHTLRIKARMMHFKNNNVRGQRESGRSRALINRVYAKARRFARRYRRARVAYMKLVGEGAWEKTLRVLEDDDVRSYKDPALVKTGPGRRGLDEEEQVMEQQAPQGIQLVAPDRTAYAHRTVHGTGETRKEHSWIWTAGGVIDTADGGEEDNQILRAEWCRSRARVKRAEEEVMLVREEMRRTLAFLQHMADEWGRWHLRWEVDGKEVPKSALGEGLEAYACLMAGFQLRLRTAFQDQWKKPLEEGEKDDDEEEEEKAGLEEDDQDPLSRLEGMQDEDDDDDNEEEL